MTYTKKVIALILAGFGVLGVALYLVFRTLGPTYIESSVVRSDTYSEFVEPFSVVNGHVIADLPELIYLASFEQVRAYLEHRHVTLAGTILVDGERVFLVVTRQHEWSIRRYRIELFNAGRLINQANEGSVTVRGRISFEYSTAGTHVRPLFVVSS
jgi:hypothetical protein